MKSFKRLLFVFTALSLGACTFLTRDDIQKQDEERQLKDQVSSIQKTHADSEEKYNDLQGDLRTVGGRVDAVEHNQQVAQQQTQKEMDGLKKLVAAQNDKITALEQHLDATETRLSAAIQALATVAPSSHSETPGAIGTTKKGEHSAGPSSWPSSWDEAEALFSKKDFKQAILKYQTYKDKNPKGLKNAEATYKMGICFAELGRKKEAKEFYQATIETYPGTPSAKKAKFRLSQLK